MTREEAIEYLHKLFMQAEITDEYGDMDDTTPYETAVDMAIEALQERKTGKWIPQPGGGYCCSKCGMYALHDVDGNFALLFKKSKYCPECGVKMENSQ